MVKNAVGLISLIVMFGVIGTSTVLYFQNMTLIKYLNDSPEIISIDVIVELFDGSTTFLLKQSQIPIDITY